MKKNQIGSSELYVSPLTLGCMSLGTDKEKAIKLIHHAIDAGINHLDTADLYNFGINEEIVGEAVKHNREKVIVTTKVGNHFDKKEQSWFWDPSSQYIEKAVHHSLKRLKTDYIDLYLLHGGTIDDPIDDVIETFERLKKEGTIRAYGISSIRPNVIQRYVKDANIDAIMMQYSILDRRPEELLDFLHKHQVSVLARGPLSKGLLSDNWGRQGDEKIKDGYVDYDKETLVKTMQHLEKLQEPLTKLAFQYVLNHPSVATAVFGASSMKQLEENIQYVHTPSIESGLYKAIQKMTKQSYYTEHRF